MENTPFVNIPTRIIQSKKISFKAIGLLAFMISKRHELLTIEIIRNESLSGGQAINSAMKELKQTGLVAFKRYSDGSGEYIINLKAI